MQLLQKPHCSKSFTVPHGAKAVGLMGFNPFPSDTASVSGTARGSFSALTARLSFVPQSARKSSVQLGAIQQAEPVGDSEANRTMTIGQLVMFTFLAAAAGPYGSEPIVANGGPLLAILGFVIVPWMFSFPLSMITAELATAMPDDGGIVRFVDRVMPKVFGFLSGYVALMAGCLTNAADTIILLQYLGTVAPAVSVGEAGSYVVIGGLYTFVLVLNILGISSIGPFSKWLSACILIPFFVMFLMSLRYVNETGHLLGTISPIITGQGSASAAKDALQRYSGAMVLSMLGFFLPAACAGSVQNVATAFPRGMLLAVVLVIFNYVIPIITGVLASRYDNGLWGCGPYPNSVAEGTDKSDYQWTASQCSPEFNLLSAYDATAAIQKCNQCIGGKWTHWTTGYYSVVAYVLGGKPLQWIVVMVALLGQFGTILSGVCCNAYSVKALADLNMLPKGVGWMHPKFNSPVAAIGIMMPITSFFAFFFNWYQANGGGGAFDNLAFAASMLTLIVNSVMMIAFLMLRHKEPDLKRPFRIPVDSLLANVFLCLPTLGITIYMLAVCELTEIIFLVTIVFIGLCIWYCPSLFKAFLRKMLSSGSPEYSLPLR
jgi:amino acid transporter